MMDRIPEPGLMNDEVQASAYALADFTSAHNLFVEKFKEKFPGFSFNDIVLDLGCGPCDVTRRFANAYPEAGFHAVDGANEMLKHAAVLNEKAGLTQRIRLIEESIPNAKLPQPFYHLVISNSLLHHCHDPFSLWNTIQDHAKPYAHVFVMDLIRPLDEHSVDFLVEEYAAGEAEILKKDFKIHCMLPLRLKKSGNSLTQWD